jgi:hypothetical protein
MDILERLRKQCDHAKRAGLYVQVADLRWLLDEVEQRERDFLMLLDNIESLHNG